MTVRKFVDYDNEAYIWEKTKNKFVAKENGKGLSESNYTQEEKAKLANIESGAEANVNADWNASTGDAAILNKPGAASSSADGLMSSTDKSKLDGIESGAEANVNADWNASSGDAQILNKPTIPTVDTSMSDSSNNAIANATVKGYIDTAIGSVTGVSFEVVQSLPVTGETGVIYLVSHVTYTYEEATDVTSENFATKKSTLYESDGSGGYTLTDDDTFDSEATYYYRVAHGDQQSNVYDEYIWLTGSSSYEKIGTTDVDLSGYMLVTDMTPLTTAEIDAICV